MKFLVFLDFGQFFTLFDLKSLHFSLCSLELELAVVQSVLLICVEVDLKALTAYVLFFFSNLFLLLSENFYNFIGQHPNFNLTSENINAENNRSGN